VCIPLIGFFFDRGVVVVKQYMKNNLLKNNYYLKKKKASRVFGVFIYFYNEILPPGNTILIHCRILPSPILAISPNYQKQNLRSSCSHNIIIHIYYCITRSSSVLLFLYSLLQEREREEREPHRNRHTQTHTQP